MSFDPLPFGVRDAAALAASHAHPTPPEERAEVRQAWLRFYVYLTYDRHRFTDWPARERVR